MVKATPDWATVRSAPTEAAKAAAPRGFLEQCETLRAITAGRNKQTTPVVSRLQTLLAEEARCPACTQGPYPLRQVFADSSKKKTGFAPPRLAWRMRSANPTVRLLSAGDGQIDGTSRVAENSNRNRVGSMEQSG
jgi:hypothetical protein